MPSKRPSLHARLLGRSRLRTAAEPGRTQPTSGWSKPRSVICAPRPPAGPSANSATPLVGEADGGAAERQRGDHGAGAAEDRNGHRGQARLALAVADREALLGGLVDPLPQPLHVARRPYGERRGRSASSRRAWRRAAAPSTRRRPTAEVRRRRGRRGAAAAGSPAGRCRPGTMSRSDVEVDRLPLARRPSSRISRWVSGGSLPAAAGQVRPPPQPGAGHVAGVGRPEQAVLLEGLHQADDRRLGQAGGRRRCRGWRRRAVLGQQRQDVQRALDAAHALRRRRPRPLPSRCSVISFAPARFMTLHTPCSFANEPVGEYFGRRSCQRPAAERTLHAGPQSGPDVPFNGSQGTVGCCRKCSNPQDPTTRWRPPRSSPASGRGTGRPPSGSGPTCRVVSRFAAATDGQVSRAVEFAATQRQSRRRPGPGEPGRRSSNGPPQLAAEHRGRPRPADRPASSANRSRTAAASSTASPTPSPSAPAEARHIGGEVLPVAGWARGIGNTALTYRAPAGVALAITPFNAPANLLAHKLGASFAAGNTTHRQGAAAGARRLRRDRRAAARSRDAARGGATAARRRRRRRRAVRRRRGRRHQLHRQRRDRRRGRPRGRRQAAGPRARRQRRDHRLRGRRHRRGGQDLRRAPATATPARAASPCSGSTCTAAGSTSSSTLLTRRGRDAAGRRPARPGHRRRVDGRRQTPPSASCSGPPRPPRRAPGSLLGGTRDGATLHPTVVADPARRRRRRRPGGLRRAGRGAAVRRLRRGDRRLQPQPVRPAGRPVHPRRPPRSSTPGASSRSAAWS